MLLLRNTSGFVIGPVYAGERGVGAEMKILQTELGSEGQTTQVDNFWKAFFYPWGLQTLPVCVAESIKGRTKSDRCEIASTIWKNNLKDSDFGT